VSVTRIGFVVVALVAGIAVVYALYQAFDERSAPPIVIEDAASTLPVIVEMRGEIEAPGVYELSPGARLQDAIMAAGGLTGEADLSTVNVARRLRDGELIVILPLLIPGSTPMVPSAAAGVPTKADDSRVKININTATGKELEALPGVGEVIASRIITYREQNGPFRSVDDLIHVEGVSDRAIDSIRELVTIGP
jgi:competence protein ComEA